LTPNQNIPQVEGRKTAHHSYYDLILIPNLNPTFCLSSSTPSLTPFSGRV
jgi:hypothetical protein